MPNKRFLPEGWQRKDYPLPPELIVRLKAEAARQNMSEAALVRSLLDEGLKHRKDRAMYKWVYKQAERLYEYAGRDGSFVHCNEDDFEAAVEEFGQRELAGSDLNPTQAIEQGWQGFYWVPAPEQHDYAKGAVDRLGWEQEHILGNVRRDNQGNIL